MILEKRSLPEHLSKIESLDTAVTLQSLVDDLHDAGEVTCHLIHSVRIKQLNLKSMSFQFVPKLRQSWKYPTTSCRMENG